MNRHALCKLLTVGGMALLCSCLWFAPLYAQIRIGPLDYRDYDLDDLEIAHPGAIAYAPQSDLFFIARINSHEEIRVYTVTPRELWLDTFDVDRLVIEDAGGATALQLAYDAQEARLLIFDPAAAQIIALATGEDGLIDRSVPAERYEIAGLAGIDVRGMVVGAADSNQETITILDRAAGEVLHLSPDDAGYYDVGASERVQRISLATPKRAQLRGLAYEPSSGHYFTFDGRAKILYELDRAGQRVMSYDLVEMNLTNLQGLVSAPSADRTDDPSMTDLFLTDSGLAEPAAPESLIPMRIDWKTIQAACSISPAYRSGRFTELYLKSLPR
jgi:hypothetical protein